MRLYCSAFSLLIGSVLSLDATASLAHLSIEELMDIQITSVARKSESISHAAAAIHVVTQEDIKHSGARSVPDLLRLVPGVFVGRIDSNKWSVGVRGGAGRFSNKLLVMLDGRTVYTPAFSGVYWEHLNLVLDDIDRIEVIRGPGATIWGANAVNGVINIITKNTSDTNGFLANVGVGTIEKKYVDLRYGAKLSPNTHYRIYAKGFDRGQFSFANGAPSGDDWRMEHGGMRFDWEKGSQKFYLSSDAHMGNIHATNIMPSLVLPYTEIMHDHIKPKAWNVLGKWEHKFSENADYSLQAFYDFYSREEGLATQDVKTLDVDGIFHYALNKVHDFTFGLGYRHYKDKFINSSFITFRPDRKNYNLLSFFAQDELSLIPEKIKLIVGSKFEHNAFSGFEAQPSMRLSWIQDSSNVFWASVSRAVRTPSRVEYGSNIFLGVMPPAGLNPFPTRLEYQGDTGFKSEKLVAYEVGYRFLVSNQMYIDMTGFYNDYDQIRSIRLGDVLIAPPLVHQPLLLSNDLYGHTVGAEALIQYNPTNWIDSKLSISRLMQNYEVKAESLSTEDDLLENDSPNWTASWITKFLINESLHLDVWMRYMGAIVHSGSRSSESQAIPGYVTFDLQASYSPNPYLELSLVAQNLNKSNRVEDINIFYTKATRVPKSIYLNAKLTF